jgi:K+-transporting ATPase c subunit
MEKSENTSMRKLVTPAIRIVIVMLAVTAVAYPLSLVAIGQSIFLYQSNGSIVNVDDKPAGSLASHRAGVHVAKILPL